MGKREEKIVNFFSGLLTNVEEINFDEVVKESLALFEEITHVMKNGTKEEKDEIASAMESVNNQVTEQFNTLCEELGLSKEEVGKLISDQSNFSPEIWSVMQNLQDGLKAVEVKEDKQKKAKRKPAQWVSA